MVNEPVSPSIKAFDFLKVTIIFVFRCTETNKSLFFGVFVTCSLSISDEKYVSSNVGSLDFLGHFRPFLGTSP